MIVYDFIDITNIKIKCKITFVISFPKFHMIISDI